MNYTKIMIALGLLSAIDAYPIDAKLPPDITAFVSGVTKAIAVANDVKELGPNFRAFPTKVNNITACMGFKSKKFPNWAAGKFDANDIDKLTGKKQPNGKPLDQTYLKNIAQICLGQVPVKNAAGTSLGTIDCSTSRKCTISLIDSMIDITGKLQSAVISKDGVMGIVFFNLVNTFAKGQEVDDMQASVSKVMDMLDKQKAMLKDIRDGISQTAKKKA